MTPNDFTSRRQAAIDNMRQMNARSVYRQQDKKPPQPEPEPPPKPQNTVKPISRPQSGFNIPILGDLLKDSDSALIIGLLLILLSENCDKTLLFALVYILL